MVVRRRGLGRWTELFVTSSLASAIATIGSYVIDRNKAGRDAVAHRCDIAQTFLSDETPTPYMDVDVRQQVTRSAALAFERCMKEP